MRRLVLVFILFLFTLPSFAQENEQTPYEIALARIEEARVSGARGLDFSNLGLTELPPEIGELSNLENLSLYWNQLSSLPPEFANLSNLQWLGIERNQFSVLPPEIIALSNLTSLGLSMNNLSSLPPEIGNLINLRHISADYNQLSSLPPEIGNLHELRVLYLVGNQLSSLPPEIGNLHELRVLDMEMNNLTILPAEIGKLENLLHLNLNKNSLSYLPRELGNLQMCPDGEDFNEPSLGMRSCGLVVWETDIIYPPREVIREGTGAILDYLRNEAWWHLQRLIAGGASSVGLVAAIVLGLRWKNRRGKEKTKRA